MTKEKSDKTAVTLDGAPVTLYGTFPAVGKTAPAFKLVDKDLQDVALQSFAGKRKVLNIVPSLDTAVCATSTRKFNEANVIPLSLMRGRDFMRNYGVKIADTALAGLTARAVLVLDENDCVLHAELVSDITHEPDYAAALAALQ